MAHSAISVSQLISSACLTPAATSSFRSAVSSASCLISAFLMCHGEKNWVQGILNILTHVIGIKMPFDKENYSSVESKRCHRRIQMNIFCIRKKENCTFVQLYLMSRLKLASKSCRIISGYLVLQIYNTTSLFAVTSFKVQQTYFLCMLNIRCS